jgi:hypothetical protein
MSSTASRQMTRAESGDGAPFRAGFDAARAGRRAECDGGAAVAGTRFAGRQFFAGTLTGDYRDFGDYPWRWYLMSSLSHAPQGYPHATVWCEAGSLEIEEDPGGE